MSQHPRTRFLSQCLFLTLSAWCGTIQAQSDHAEAEQLITQLRSKDFRAREAASRALQAQGKAAVPALREAARIANDAEVRRRIESLLEVLDKERLRDERVAAIVRSRLLPRDKGARLCPLLSGGKEREAVGRLLGPADTLLHFDAFTEEIYPAYCLTVRYDRRGLVLRVTQDGW
jgi:hypothetical protein